MIATTLAAVLAVSMPAAETLLSQERPYYATTTSGRSGATTLSAQDQALFQQGLAAARARDVVRTRQIQSQIGDPTARQLVEWALVDTSASQLSPSDLIASAQNLRGWPRAEARRAAAENALDLANVPADQVISFFQGQPPETAEGAYALANALEQRGQTQQARQLVTEWWRTRSFNATTQGRFLQRWGGLFSQADHEARLNMLLLGPHGPATQAMISLVGPERRAIAETVMALRTAYSPDAALARLSPSQALDPNVVFERVRILRAANRQPEAFGLLRYLPPAPQHDEGQDSLWSERRNYFQDALRMGSPQAAYDAMAGHGFTSGERMVDAEFFAGWAALVKLNNPAAAAQHFEALRRMSTTPITQGRANYWLGLTAEARGDQAGAQTYYREGGRYIQAFYGQLAAEKAGMNQITLPRDPTPSASDQQAFEANRLVRAMRILGDAGESSLFRVFAYQLDDDLPNAEQMALLMDMSRSYGEGFTAMMAGRAASQRGWLMPERQYPIRIPPAVPGAAPLEFTLAITRQESSFDPRARSHANARGMMQFLPATGRAVARQLGMPYSDESLYDPDYNMTLGSFHLGDLTNDFGGSMLLATVAYNAGPGRPPQWIERCGDPRGRQVDPVDFIECAPFTETRNYMMRVMENMQIYRARLNGGSAPLTLSSDIARGAAPNSGPRPYQAY